MSRVCRAMVGALGVALCAWMGACTNHVVAVLPISWDAGSISATPTLRTDPCADAGFRTVAAPEEIVCPGSSTCSCSDGDICCLPAIDTALAGWCESLSTCRTTALQCAGPESCRPHGADSDGGAGVCCLDEGPGGGTSCQATAWECYSHQIVCHADDDCLVVAPTNPFCRPADFGTPGVADKTLDGVLGICSPK